MRALIHAMLYIWAISCTTSLEPVIDNSDDDSETASESDSLGPQVDTDTPSGDTDENRQSSAVCAENTCDVNATCNDTDGEIHCTCDKGWEGDGFTCHDINECGTGRDTCSDPNGFCVNYEGGYGCDCNSGWWLATDGVTCIAPTRYTQISGTNDILCGLRTDGSFVCMGDISSGDMAAQEGPFEAISVSPSGLFVCGLTVDGNIECFGDAPAMSAFESSSVFTAIAAGGDYLCRIERDGIVKCTDDNLPTALNDKGFIQIDAGWTHACGIRDNGETVCWGENDAGQTDVPEAVRTDRNVIQVSAGARHTCAILSDRQVRCWGEVVVDYPQPSDVVFDQIASGDGMTCGITMDGGLACWGDKGTSYYGEALVQIESPGFGLRTDGTIARFDFAINAFLSIPTEGYFKQVSVYWSTVCAIRTNDTLTCLYDGEPMPNTPKTAGFKQVTAGDGVACAIDGSSAVTCWGETEIAPPEGKFVQIDLGDDRGCGIRADGTVVCFGSDSMTQKTPGGYRQVTVGVDHVCAIQTANNEPQCWGDGYYQEGRPCCEYVQLSSEDGFVCGLKTDGTAACWGYSSFGNPYSKGTFVQIDALSDSMCGISQSDGRIEFNIDIVSTPDIFLSAVSCSSGNTCGIRQDGTLVCWWG